MRSLFGSSFAALVVGLAGTGPAAAGDPTHFSLSGPDGNMDPRIYGGTPVAPCGWPSTVFLGGCSGTLVHPQVVIYAAHCGSGVGQVRFGENGQVPAKSVATKYCKTNPAYQGGGAGTDHAFCVLYEPVEAPVVPILMGCETAILAPGQEVTVVGFGNTDQGQFGIKHEVTTTINSVGNEAFIGGNGKDSCQGDSGGPVFVKLGANQNGDDTWRVFGITSYGGACGTGGYYSMMHKGMPWIEGELAADGIDITPCHDSDGIWNPGPDCFGFPLDPQSGAGTWSSWCEPGPLAGYSGICGAPFNDEPDETAPMVTITAPMQQQMFMSDGMSAQVMISVTADDGDGWGVQQVKLLIDGNEQSSASSPPYEWPADFPPGKYRIGAIAVDYAGNEGVAEEIYIGVDMEADVPPDDDTGGTEESGGTGGIGVTGEEDGGGDKGCACTAGGQAGVPLAGAGIWLLARRRRRP